MLAGIDPAELSEGALGESVAELMYVCRQLDGMAAAVAGRFAHYSEWAADGARDAIACDVSLRLLILDAKGNLVGFARFARVAPPALWGLVVRRDRHCRFAGFRAHIDKVHHIVFWSRGGPKRSDNMLGMCWFRHHLVHEGGWDLVGDANVEAKGSGPHGHVWTTVPLGG